MAEISLKGTTIHTVGNLPLVGNKAPDFIVTKTDLTDVRLSDFLGKKVVMNIFVSLDTDTCAAAMQQFNIIASQLTNTQILCISADLPFAQKRFCSAKNLDNVMSVSIFRHPEFGDNYGVKIVDGPLTGLLSRAVITVDEEGKIIYTEQVKEIMTEPDYSAIPTTA